MTPSESRVMQFFKIFLFPFSFVGMEEFIIKLKDVSCVTNIDK